VSLAKGESQKITVKKGETNRKFAGQPIFDT